MNEEDYRAEMAKQAKLANLIALRALCAQSKAASEYHSSASLDSEIRALRAP